MSQVIGLHRRNQLLNSKRTRKSLLAAAASAVMAVTAAHANTEVDVPNGTSDLTTLSTSGSSDLTLTNITYSPTTIADSATALTLGTLNDLDATQTLSITAPSTGTITLNGGTNSQPPNAGGGGGGGPEATTDLLYVASGGSLNLSGAYLTLTAGADSGTLGTIDVNGYANIGTLSCTGGNVFTLNGTGRVNMSVNNLATNLANFVVASGTLSNSATSGLGAGTIALGASSGSANATILDSANVNLTNAITVAAGSTGTLRLGGGLANSTPSFTGTITLANNVTFGSGSTSTIYNNNFNDAIGGTGNVTIDAGIGTVDYYANAMTYSGSTTIADGTLQLSGSIGTGTTSLTSALTLGTGTGTLNATVLIGNSVYNTLTLATGDTGTLRLASTNNYSYYGLITVPTGTTLTLGSGGSSTNGLLVRTGGITGGGNVVVDAGSGIVNFYDNSPTEYAFGGFTTILSGTLEADQNVGTGTIFLGTSTGTLNAAFLTGYGVPATNPINVVAGDTGVLRIGGSSSAGRSINGNIYLNNNVTLGGGGGTFTTVVLRTGGISGTGNVTVDGGTTNLGTTDVTTAATSYVQLNDVNSFSGSVLVNTGELQLSNAGALTSANQLGVSTGADVNVLASVTVAGLEDGTYLSNGTGTGFVTDYSANNRTLTFGGTTAGASYTYSGAFTANSTGSLSLVAASTFAGTETISGNDSISGTVAANGGTLAFTGNEIFAGNVTVGGGTLVLNGTNTFNGASGAAVVTTGVLSTNNLAGGIGNSGTVTLGAGTLLYTGTNATLNQNVSGSAGYTFNVSSPTASLTATGTLSSGFKVGGAGTFVLSTAGTNSLANVTINSGVLDDESTHAAQLTTSLTINGGTFLEGSSNQSNTDLIHFAATVTDNSGGAYDLNGHALEEFAALAGSGGLVTNGDAGTTSTLIVGADGGGGSFGGVIQNGAGTVAFTKETSLLAGGTQTLAGTSTYTGPTLVSGGTLNVIGALSGTGTISVSGSSNLVLAGANALSSAAIVNVGSLASAYVNNAQTIASIASAGNATFSAGTSIVGLGSGVGTGTGTTGLTSGGITGTGSLTVNGSANLYASNITQSQLIIGSGSTVTIADSAAPGNTAATSVVTDVNNAGTLDLKNNDLIVLDTTQYTAVRTLINNAADGGGWDQPGITSSSAKANSGQYGLGYAQASTIGSTSFDGHTFTDAVLVKYTLLGDTQLRRQVGIGDYDTVLNNFGTGTDWYQGNFHYSGTVGIGDYDDVLNNFGGTATGNLAAGPALARGLSPALGINPNFAKADLKLEVNTVSGDVYVLANASVGFAGYTVADPSAHLLGGSTSPDPAKLLSVSSANGGNTNVYETAGTYVNWNRITEVANQIAEGQNNNGYANHSSRDDTVNIPSGGTIDFGDIYNTAAGVQDITFNFAEAGSNPTNGPAYYGAEVDYITASTPEPGSVSLVAIGAMGLLSQRRRRLAGACRQGKA